LNISPSGIAGSYGKCMLRFLRRLHIVFESGCTVGGVFDDGYSNRNEVES
jgi:hypothetical protein